MSDIKIVVVQGHMFIGEVQRNTNKVIIKRPRLLAFAPPSIMIIADMKFDDFEIEGTLIMSEPPDFLKAEYMKITTGLLAPSESALKVR